MPTAPPRRMKHRRGDHPLHRQSPSCTARLQQRGGGGPQSRERPLSECRKRAFVCGGADRKTFLAPPPPLRPCGLVVALPGQPNCEGVALALPAPERAAATDLPFWVWPPESLCSRPTDPTTKASCVCATTLPLCCAGLVMRAGGLPHAQRRRAARAHNPGMLMALGRQVVLVSGGASSAGSRPCSELRGAAASGRGRVDLRPPLTPGVAACVCVAQAGGRGACR